MRPGASDRRRHGGASPHAARPRRGGDNVSATTSSKTEAVLLPAAGSRRPVPRPRRRGLLQFGHWWWALPGILMVLAIHYVATAAGAVFAFTNWSGIGDFDWIGLQNFEAIFTDPSKLL